MQSIKLLASFVLFMVIGSTTQGQTVDQLLKDKNTRQQLFSAIIKDSSLFAEFMNNVKKSPSCCNKMAAGQEMKMMCDSCAKMQNIGGHQMMMHKHNGEQVKNDSKDTVVYTCSMHPEIESPNPGKCPKCGMDLVKKVKPVQHDKMKMN